MCLKRRDTPQLFYNSSKHYFLSKRPTDDVGSKYSFVEEIIGTTKRDCKKPACGEIIERQDMMRGTQHDIEPPKLRRTAEGGIDANSLADLIEWFLNFDELTARMRHPMVDELFKWKQADDAENGIGTYPFENAEARFAVGVFQALAQNDSEPLLKLWIRDLLNALSESRATKTELSDAYRLEDDPEKTPVEKAAKLTTNAERRLYLSSCWLESLCTAEARVIGWVYQEIYGKAFTPSDTF